MILDFRTFSTECAALHGIVPKMKSPLAPVRQATPYFQSESPLNFERIWPQVVIGIVLGLSVAWACLLGYGLSIAWRLPGAMFLNRW